MDIPSPEELLAPVERGVSEESGMEIHDRGKQHHFEEDNGSSEKAGNLGSNYVPVKSKSQRKRDQKKRSAQARATRGSDTGGPVMTDPARVIP